MDDPRERFSATVEAYRRYRPDYPDALIEWIVGEAGIGPGDRVLDIGCGTGITTRQFTGRGLRVVGLDPNRAMLAAAAAEDGGPSYVRAVAEVLPFQAGTIAAATSGQAFHWLDLDRVIPDLARVLRPGGLCVAFWNERETDTTPFLRDYENLLLERCPDYPVASAVEVIERIASHPAVGRTRQADFSHQQRFDRDGLHGRAWSSSYVVHGVREPAVFDAALHDVFDRHQVAGEVAFLYQTRAIAFAPRRGDTKN
jgi:SAM-dependent methyltransferase